MVRFFTPLYSKASLCKSSSIIRNKTGCLTIIKGHLVPFIQTRPLADEKDHGKRSGKEEQIDSVKMPGFVHPDSHNEEGYFTQKAKQQIEELKRRLEKPKIENKEKKE